jgi:hypothetical protein
MKRKVRQICQWTLVTTLATIMGSSPVSAGWLLHRMQCQSSCPPEPVCVPVPCCPAPMPVVDCCPCGCDIAMSWSQPMMVVPMESVAPTQHSDSVIESQMPTEPPVAAASAPPEPEPISDSDVATEQPATEPPAVTEAPEAKAPAIEEPAVEAPTVEEPAIEAAVENPFRVPAEAPEAETPATEPADIFGDPPAAEAPATEAVENIFGDAPEAPATEAPATESVDDIFGDPPAADAPATESVDDIFGDAPAADAPATESVDDIFGDAPAAEAPATESVDNIFGGEAAEDDGEDAPAEGSIDDIFGGAIDSTNDTPASAPSELGGDSFDDIFGTPAEVAEPGAGDSVKDLFGVLPAPTVEETVAELPAPIEVAPTGVQVVAATIETNSLDDTRVRTWIDNTGHYHVEGRLIEINSDNVRLLKSSGRTCTVSFSRLSEADAAYVKSIRTKVLASNFAMLTGK